LKNAWLCWWIANARIATTAGCNDYFVQRVSNNRPAWKRSTTKPGADDLGLKPLTQTERHDLLEIIEDRHDLHSTIITSQLPISSWHSYLNEPTIADALLDRLLTKAHRIELKGESLRKNRQKLTDREHSK